MGLRHLKSVANDGPFEPTVVLSHAKISLDRGFDSHEMQARERLSLEQVRTFLESSDDLGFRGRNRDEVYSWVNLTLRQQGHQALKRSERGLVRRYLEKTAGLSRARIARLITVYLSGEEVKARP